MDITRAASTRVKYQTWNEATLNAFGKAARENLKVLYSKIAVQEGDSGGDQAPDAKMEVYIVDLSKNQTRATLTGKFNEKKHCETDIYDQVYNYMLDLFKGDREAAIIGTQNALRNEKLLCKTASCFLCTAIMAVLGVTPQTKFTKIYNDYVFPKVITESPDNLKALLGDDAWKIYLTLSPENQAQSLRDLPTWLDKNK